MVETLRVVERDLGRVITNGAGDDCDRDRDRDPPPIRDGLLAGHHQHRMGTDTG
jgi:hypothetical protein